MALKTGLGCMVVGDALACLDILDDESVDLVFTSPPYEGQATHRRPRAWYEGYFMDVARAVRRVLRPQGSFVLNYRSPAGAAGRGVLQYELVLWLRAAGFVFGDDYVWGKTNPPPGRFKGRCKDAVEYCYQFGKSATWAFYPEQALVPARWAAADRARRAAQPANHVRATSPSGHGRVRMQAARDWVLPTNLVLCPAAFGPNPTRHPTRFPADLPRFFLQLFTRAGDFVVDPFGGTGTTGVVAQELGRRWLVVDEDERHVPALAARVT